MQKCFGIHPPLISDQTTIKKTVWRSFCSKVGLVKSSAMGASDLYSPGVKVMIKRKKHKFYGGLGTIMTKPLHKKAAFRVFMLDAATTIEVTLKDIKVPKGVLERMEREANYKHMLARRQNQDWFGLPIVRKVGALKKARYRMSKAMRHRSAKAEIKAFDDAAAKNADMDYSNRIVSESLMYVPPVKTQSWEQQFHEAEALRVVSEWEWLRELATGKKYWLNIVTDERREFMPYEFVTWKDKLHYFTIYMLREQYRRYTIPDYEIVEAVSTPLFRLCFRIIF